MLPVSVRAEETAREETGPSQVAKTVPNHLPVKHFKEENSTLSTDRQKRQRTHRSASSDSARETSHKRCLTPHSLSARHLTGETGKGRLASFNWSRRRKHEREKNTTRNAFYSHAVANLQRNQRSCIPGFICSLALLILSLFSCTPDSI